MSIIRKFNSSRKQFSCNKIWLYGIISLIIISIIVLWVAKKKENLEFYWNHPVNSTSNRPASGYVTMQKFDGRLGNQMFEFIAMFHVAQKTNREVVLFNGHDGHELEKYFSLGVRKINRSCPCFLFREKFISYDNRIDKMIRSKDARNSPTILLRGYFQSLMYVKPVENLVVNHMKFQESIETFARDILRESIPIGWREGQFTRVGIHNRRGDLVKKTAPESYFKTAMKYFTDRYKLVQFVVASDDIEWCREHITYDNQSSSVNVTYSVKHSPGQDMAILSLCDHVIFSVGTFGWMSAWLANGTTVYYANFDRIGSPEKRFNFFPPHWIPME